MLPTYECLRVVCLIESYPIFNILIKTLLTTCNCEFITGGTRIGWSKTIMKVSISNREAESFLAISYLFKNFLAGCYLACANNFIQLTLLFSRSSIMK